MEKFIKSFEEIIAVPNLLIAWDNFLSGKKQRPDVVAFQSRLMDNILSLHSDLRNGTYRHGPYIAFKISDPKPRQIHKASVRDRLLHHLLYAEIYPYFDRSFVYDSYSCRLGKGTHKAIYRLHNFIVKASKNDTKTIYLLKGDVRKFFSSIDHKILKNILSRYISDTKLLNLFFAVIDSFATPRSAGIGLPLGNVSSQILANIYLNEFDQFVKRQLKIKHYLRYADDFVLIFSSRDEVNLALLAVKDFLKNKLALDIHPNKIFIKTPSQGLDFLGWTQFYSHRVLRTVSKKRMFRKLKNTKKEDVLNSYLGLLGHGDAYYLSKLIFKNFNLKL